jgi:hypothetical protein
MVGTAFSIPVDEFVVLKGGGRVSTVWLFIRRVHRAADGGY